MLNKNTRSLGNIVGIVIFSILTLIGVSLILFALNAAMLDDASPDSKMRGSVSIAMMFLTILSAPLTAVSLFFIGIFALNNTSLSNALQAPVDIRQIYKRKSLRSGVIFTSVGFGAIIISALTRVEGSSFIGGVVGPLMFALTLLGILCVIQGFVYLSRANSIEKSLSR